MNANEQRTVNDLRERILSHFEDVVEMARGDHVVTEYSAIEADARHVRLIEKTINDAVTVVLQDAIMALRPDLSDWENFIELDPNGWRTIDYVSVDSGNISIGDGGMDENLYGQVTIDTGWGDGPYAVEILKAPNGRTAAMRIVFIEDGSPDIFTDLFKKRD